MEWSGYDVSIGSVMVTGDVCSSYKQFFYVFDIDEHGVIYSHGISTGGTLYNNTYTRWGFDRKASGKELQEFYSTLRVYDCVIDNELKTIRKESHGKVYKDILC